MIKSRLVFLILVFVVNFVFSQDYSTQWEGYFSFNQIKALSQSTTKIYAAAQNAVFNYDSATNQTVKQTTINGLSGEVISAMHYSETYELTVIGYENGLIDVVFDDATQEVLKVVDILEKPSISPEKKYINDLYEYNGKVYIATDYGLSVYDLNRLEFGDTYFVGNLGAQIRVQQTTVYQDYIYLACLDNHAIRRADLNNPNIVDYAEWEQISNGNFVGIATVADKPYAVKTNRKIYEITNGSLTELFQYNNPVIDIKNVTNNLIITTKNDAYVYDNNFNLLAQVSVDDQTLNTQFTCATIDNQFLYIGTEDLGLFKTNLQSPNNFENISPEGLLLNNAFSVNTTPNNLWVTYGEYRYAYNPGPLQKRGISHLQNETWTHISKDEIFDTKNLNAIAINPFVENHVFISSCRDGVLEVQDDVVTNWYNEENSTLQSRIDTARDIRQTAAAFDANGVLWTTTGFSLTTLNAYNPSTNQWTAHPLESIVQATNNENGCSDVIIDDNGTKWLGGYKNGVIAYNENNSAEKIRTIKDEEQNMPSARVFALAMDRNNQLWIGTNLGLRVLYNTNNIFTDPSIQVNNIVVEEGGIAQEVLFEQFVSDIKVDGSNNKWVGTLGSGLFYFTADGRENIYHFTTSNSPIPSNDITDMALDAATGTLYVATLKGMVAFKAGGAVPVSSIADAYAYPNPVRPKFNMNLDKIKIKGLSNNVNVKITDIEGNLVAEADSSTNLRYSGYNLEIDGGIAFWNGKNLANNSVASGVYLAMLTDLDSLETKVIKIMVVR